MLSRLIITIFFFTSISMAMPKEVDSLSKKTYQILQTKKTFEQKWQVLQSYQKQIDKMQKTMKNPSDTQEYYGMLLAFDFIDKNQLKNKNCKPVLGRLKSEFYPRGTDFSKSPKHYQYAVRFVKSFCQ